MSKRRMSQANSNWTRLDWMTPRQRRAWYKAQSHSDVYLAILFDRAYREKRIHIDYSNPWQRGRTPIMLTRKAIRSIRRYREQMNLEVLWHRREAR